LLNDALCQRNPGDPPLPVDAPVPHGRGSGGGPGSDVACEGAHPQSAYGRLLDAATFSGARLDPEARTVCWDGLAREITADGAEQAAPLDFCPDVLYQLSTPLGQDLVEQAAEDRKAAEYQALL